MFAYEWWYSLTAHCNTFVSEKVDQRLQEAIKQSNNLRINGKELKGKTSDFDNEGQIGSGTCGQVYKMRYRPTGHVMAVKVIQLLS